MTDTLQHTNTPASTESIVESSAVTRTKEEKLAVCVAELKRQVSVLQTSVAQAERVVQEQKQLAGQAIDAKESFEAEAREHVAQKEKAMKTIITRERGFMDAAQQEERDRWEFEVRQRIVNEEREKLRKEMQLETAQVPKLPPPQLSVPLDEQVKTWLLDGDSRDRFLKLVIVCLFCFCFCFCFVFRAK